jgi:hypothetical protein
MGTHSIVAGALALGILALAPTQGQAAVYSQPASPRQAAMPADLVAPVQYWRGGPRYRGFYGRPYWHSRPWYRRPYYGTIVAGVALGAIIGVTAYGIAPRRPSPDLCWYWVDPSRSRGYWDYC